MVTRILTCWHCGSVNLIRFGKQRNAKQRYRCHDCQRCSLEHPGSRAYSEDFKQIVLAAYQERSSMRGISRTFGISRNTLSDWLKKRQNAAPALTDAGPCSAR